NTSVCISDDLAAARDVMRPLLALYIGGMGSRKANFYNRTARAYGFEAEAMAALPDALIDLVTLCGPPDRVRDRLRLLEAAGVGTLIATPMAFTFEEK